MKKPNEIKWEGTGKMPGTTPSISSNKHFGRWSEVADLRPSWAVGSGGVGVEEELVKETGCSSKSD
jgi:hypothetical protein